MTTSEYITVFNEHRMFVFHYCNKLIKNRADAEDITSHVFISVLKNIEKVDANKIQPFLKTIAKNKCIDIIRRRNVIEIISSSTIDEDIEDIREAEITSDVLSSIYDIINTLPFIQQKYIKLKYIDGYESYEIAKILNRASSTIRNQTFVALEKIRGEIKNRGITLG